MLKGSNALAYCCHMGRVEERSYNRAKASLAPRGSQMLDHRGRLSRARHCLFRRRVVVRAFERVFQTHVTTPRREGRDHVEQKAGMDSQ